MLGHKRQLYKIKRTEIVSTLFSDYDELKIDVNFKQTESNTLTLEINQLTTKQSVGHKGNQKRFFWKIWPPKPKTQSPCLHLTSLIGSLCSQKRYKLSHRSYEYIDHLAKSQQSQERGGQFAALLKLYLLSPFNFTNALVSQLIQGSLWRHQSDQNSR